jgi:hypothetical protein
VSEWDLRQLCPDGSCVGVIGSDGTCKVCGRAAPNWGDERKRGMVDEPEDEEQVEAEDRGPASEPVEPERDQDWDERKLCPDEGCIGVIGDDGTCKTCGRSAA